MIEQILSTLNQPPAWFWAAHQGGEVDLLVQYEGRWLGFEIKFSDALKVSKLLRNSVQLLELDHLFLVCLGVRDYAVSENISICRPTKSTS